MFRRLGFLLAVALVAAAPVAAQDRPVQLTIGGGYTGVYGDASDRIGNGGNFTIGALFKASPTISLQGEYGWNGMKQKQILFPVSPTVNPLNSVPTNFFADANMQYGDFNVLFGPNGGGGRVGAYALTGLGVYYRPVSVTTPGVGFATVCDPFLYVCFPTAVEVDRVVGDRSSTDFGMNFGGGVNFRVTDNTSMYVEIRYHYIWGPQIDEQAVPLSAEAQPRSLKANGKFLPITFGFRF